ncbi:helix-turn-helix domain-containing protein [Caulobacter sp. 73W]|uniref:Helix-turn-helix domain-containing protein n=1 Tax=Caulobacter sp. 73W TaxID=3161137 RepID=A0AB39KP04_9CAUL
MITSGQKSALLNTTEAARVLSISPRTLEDWRLRGGGPAFHKLGRAVRYDSEELEAFVRRALRHNTACPQPLSKAA